MPFKTETKQSEDKPGQDEIKKAGLKNRLIGCLVQKFIIWNIRGPAESVKQNKKSLYAVCHKHNQIETNAVRWKQKIAQGYGDSIYNTYTQAAFTGSLSIFLVMNSLCSSHIFIYTNTCTHVHSVLLTRLSLILTQHKHIHTHTHLWGQQPRRLSVWVKLSLNL